MAGGIHLANFLIPLLFVSMLQLLSSLPQSTKACKGKIDFGALKRRFPHPCDFYPFPVNFFCKGLLSSAKLLSGDNFGENPDDDAFSRYPRRFGPHRFGPNRFGNW